MLSIYIYIYICIRPATGRAIFSGRPGGRVTWSPGQCPVRGRSAGKGIVRLIIVTIVILVVSLMIIVILIMIMIIIIMIVIVAVMIIMIIVSLMDRTHVQP